MANGDVRFGYIHFAFLGPESQWAGEASECAADQDAFWEYHDALFINHAGENQGAYSKDNLKQFAADLGLDTKPFNECMDSEKYAEIVISETRWAQSVGVRSTPTIVVNGFTVVGAQPFDVFENLFATFLEP